MKAVNKLVLLIFLSLSLSFCTTPKKATAVLDPAYYTDMYGWDRDGGLSKTMLGRGINMGNFLESPLDQGGEGAWNGKRKIRKKYFALITKAGFKTVRIPVRWDDYTDTKTPYAIKSQFLDRVREVVDWALAQDLRVVLNVHHYTEMMDNTDRTLSYHQERLISIWDQICDTFDTTNYPVNKVVFELLNEPNGRVGADEWNSMIAELTNVIWKVKGQRKRKIMIGTANWGGVPGLRKLKLPSKCNRNNTIITIHYYEPLHFTHQGASWTSGAEAWIGTSWTGTNQEQQDFTVLLDQVVSWNSGKNFEIFVGEFGVYSKYADPSHQKAWTAFLTREAEKRGFSWAYWEFCSGFGAYDPVNNKWRPQLLKALIPAGK